jgi:hypothetical protein
MSYAARRGVGAVGWRSDDMSIRSRLRLAGSVGPKRSGTSIRVRRSSCFRMRARPPYPQRGTWRRSHHEFRTRTPGNRADSAGTGTQDVMRDLLHLQGKSCRAGRPLAMQNVEGSSPFIRSPEVPGNRISLALRERTGARTAFASGHESGTRPGPGAVDAASAREVHGSQGPSQQRSICAARRHPQRRPSHEGGVTRSARDCLERRLADVTSHVHWT